MVVRDDETLACGCGGRGCLEQYASATGVVRLARMRLGTEAPSTALDVAILARSGNQQARTVFEDVGHALAIALTGLINTLNLPLYLLGGGVCDAWDLLSPPMFRELERRSYVYRLTKPSVLGPARLEDRMTYVLKAELGPAAGLLGACVLGLHHPTSGVAPMGEILAHQ